jgi:proline iminopeptidase
MRSRESYLSVPGARLYVREIGDDAPLVILHGGPDFNHRYLLPEMDRLSRAFRLIYYDQRGRGRSSPGVVPEDVSIDSDVDDLDRLRQFMEFDRISVLGHSWGAILAMEYAARYPDRVARLIVLNSAPPSHADLSRFRKHRENAEAASLARMRSIAATQTYASGDVGVESEYYRAHFSATLRRPEHLERVIGSLRVDFTPDDIVKARTIEGRLYAQTWDSPGYDLCAKLGRSRPRLLVVHGDRDLIPVPCAMSIAGAIPGARLVVLKDCGHFSFLERPDDVENAVVEFFSTD